MTERLTELLAEWSIESLTEWLSGRSIQWLIERSESLLEWLIALLAQSFIARHASEYIEVFSSFETRCECISEREINAPVSDKLARMCQ